MEYRRLGRTGLKVSTICLGTMQFGWSADEPTAHEIMSAAVDNGCNFFDTADIYSTWVEGNPGGVSERMIGRHGDVAVQRTVEALDSSEQLPGQTDRRDITRTQSCAGLGQGCVVKIFHRGAAVQEPFSTVYL